MQHPEDKRELKRRLQQIQRHEAEAEVGRQKRVEQWRQLVVEEEREERERKREIEKLEKMIDREMQQAHHRYHTDVNSAKSTTYIPNSHTDSSKVPLCSSASATNVLLDPEVVTGVQEAPLTFEQPKELSLTVMHGNESLKLDSSEVTDMSKCKVNAAAASRVDQQEDCCNNDEDLLPSERKDYTELREADVMKKSTTEQPTVEANNMEHTDPPSVPTSIETAPHDDTSATVNEVKLSTTVQQQDADLSNTEDDEAKTEHKVTESNDLAVERSGQLQTVSTDLEVSTSAQVLSITEPTVQDTVAHKSDATPTVQTTTDVTKTQQCHSKELQTQDTTVSMAQPRATQHSESTIQFTTDSDTRSGPYDTKFWYHLCNTDGINKTPESMSTVFICCHSEYSCVILYLLLYS